MNLHIKGASLIITAGLLISGGGGRRFQTISYRGVIDSTLSDRGS